MLGPVDVIDNGSTVALGGKQQRRLLAVLVANRGHVVPIERLVDVLWTGDDGPIDAVATVHTYIARLRRALGARAVVRIEPGYQLNVSSDRVDADDFEQLLAAARGESGRVAVGMYERAQSLWRGSAYLNFVEEWWARSEVERLAELRLVAAEERFEWLLQLGDHVEAVAELQGLVAVQPLRQRLVGQLMVALDTTGREAEAHRVYRAFRTAVRDLGLDPSADLLTLDRSIAAGHAQSEPELPTGNLPRPRVELIGREADKRLVGKVIAPGRLVTLTGPAGVGKTQLALTCARTVQSGYGTAFGSSHLPLRR